MGRVGETRGGRDGFASRREQNRKGMVVVVKNAIGWI